MSDTEKLKQEVLELLEAKFGANKAAIDTAMNVYLKSDSGMPAYWQVMKESLIRTSGMAINKPAQQTAPAGNEFVCQGFDGGVVITEYKASVSSPKTEIDIPSEINGKKVIGIGSGAFNNADLEKVTIPNSVTFIDESAFRNNKFKSIIIPPSVKEIGEAAFSYCALESIDIPDSVEKIGEKAFTKNKSLNAIKIPDSVKEIGEEAFCSCALANVIIGCGIETISEKAFTENEIESLIIPDTVKVVAESAFAENKIAQLTIGKGVTTIEEKAFFNNKLASITIPDNVKFIESRAFDENPLTLAVIPDNEIEIDERAFPKSLKKDGIKKSSTHVFESENDQYTKPEYFKWKKTKDEKGIIIEDYTGKETKINIPPQISGLPVVEIKQFRNKTLASVVFPDTITEIGSHMLGFCGAVKSVTLGRNVKIIGSYAFQENKNLTEIIIPDGVKIIENGAFKDCGLTSVNIPDGVTYIGTKAFACNNLKHVTIPKGVTVVTKESFAGNSLASVTLPEGLVLIEDFAFFNNKLTEVKFPESLKAIRYKSFTNNKLKELVLPDRLTYLDQTTFNDNKIARLSIGKELRKINIYTFFQNSLTELVIPPNVDEIAGDMAFGDNKLTSVTFPEGIVVGPMSFLKNSLKNVIRPKNAYITENSFDQGVKIIDPEPRKKSESNKRLYSYLPKPDILKKIDNELNCGITTNSDAQPRKQPRKEDIRMCFVSFFNNITDSTPSSMYSWSFSCTVTDSDRDDRDTNATVTCWKEKDDALAEEKKVKADSKRFFKRIGKITVSSNHKVGAALLERAFAIQNLSKDEILAAYDRRKTKDCVIKEVKPEGNWQWELEFEDEAVIMVMIGWNNMDDADRAEEAYKAQCGMYVKRYGNVTAYIRTTLEAGITTVAAPFATAASDFVKMWEMTNKNK